MKEEKGGLVTLLVGVLTVDHEVNVGPQCFFFLDGWTYTPRNNLVAGNS
jgi:hypothetical protein